MHGTTVKISELKILSSSFNTLANLLLLVIIQPFAAFCLSKWLCRYINYDHEYYDAEHKEGRSQWPRGLRRGSAAVLLLRLWARIPPEAWMFVCCECCVLSGRGLCNELITRPEESYRLWCIVVCDIETSWMRRPWPTGGCYAKKMAFFFKFQCFTVHFSIQ